MTVTPWSPNSFTELLGIELPIALGPFGGVSSVELAAVVSNGGGLGSFGLYGYEPDRIAQTATALRQATDAPFALNIWLEYDNDHAVLPDDDEFAKYAQALAPYFAEVGLPVPQRPERYLPGVDEQVQAVFEARPAALSFVFGVPSAAIVDQARDLGIITIGAATTVDEAIALEAGGIDAIVATGMEAGGHRVSFLRPAEESLVGTMALVPQVVDAVSVPVIAAGGIADGRAAAAALTLGASAVQVGTAFLATDQSAAPAVHREALRTRGGRTVLTRAPSGRLARGIPNRLTTEVTEIAPFPVQNWLTGKFRARAGELGMPELMSLWAGQSAPLATEHDAATLLRTIATDAARQLRD